MENITNQSSITQPNSNSVYSSMEVSKQQEIRIPIQNPIDGEVIEVFTEEMIPKPVVHKESSHSTDLPIINYKFDNPTIVIPKANYSNQPRTSNTRYVEYGYRDFYSRRQGSFYRYTNNELVAELVYEDDVLVYVHRGFKDNKMKEYNMDHELIYEGNYDGDRENGFYRSGSGKEYRNGQLYYEGRWNEDAVNGYGVLYSQNSEDYYEGEWDNDWLLLDNGYYCHEKDRYYKHLPGYFFSWFDVIIGVLFLLTILIFTFESGQHNDYDMYYLILGVLYIIKSIIDNCSIILCYFLEGFIMFYLMLFFFSFQSEYKVIAFNNSLLCTILYYLTQILCPSFIFSSFAQLLLGYKYPESIYAYFTKRNIHGWYMIYLERICYYIMFIQLYIILFYFGYELPKDYVIVYCIFMLLDGFMYWIVSWLHSQSGKLFTVGIYIGIVWGLLSCILCIVLFFVIDYHPDILNSMYYFECAQNGIIFVMCYTWIISLTSILLYIYNKPDNTLPITHSTFTV